MSVKQICETNCFCVSEIADARIVKENITKGLSIMQKAFEEKGNLPRFEAKCCVKALHPISQCTWLVLREKVHL